MIAKFTDSLKINNSKSITFDEMEFKTKGKRSFFIDVMDIRTRYMLSSGYYMQRGYKELLEVLKKAKKKSTNKTLNFYTDGLLVYPRILKNVYSYRKGRGFYHKVIASKDNSFNWKIKRLHNSIRERTKTLRQFNTLHSARAIMKGYEIFYNFCRKHQGINAYPYELATDLKLGKNRWLDLIGLGSEKL